MSVKLVALPADEIPLAKTVQLESESELFFCTVNFCGSRVADAGRELHVSFTECEAPLGVRPVIRNGYELTAAKLTPSYQVRLTSPACVFTVPAVMALSSTKMERVLLLDAATGPT